MAEILARAAAVNGVDDGPRISARAPADKAPMTRVEGSGWHQFGVEVKDRHPKFPASTSSFFEAAEGKEVPETVAMALSRLDARQLDYEVAEEMARHFGAESVVPLLFHLERCEGAHQFLRTFKLLGALGSDGKAALERLGQYLDDLDRKPEQLLCIVRACALIHADSLPVTPQVGWSRELG